MCYRPLHIRTPKVNFNLSSDSLYLDVPCGHCCECRTAMQDEWFVRSYFQWLDCQSHGGMTFFVTLTFDEDHIPVHDGQYVFSKNIVQKFLKRLRKDCSRFGYVVKYLITSEYGGNTHRPHHHSLLYFYPTTINLNLNYVKNSIRTSWQQGFISFGSQGGFVNSSKAISYTTKYITKDIDFDYCLDKEYRPFHLQSKGFGSFLFDKLKLQIADNWNKPIFVPVGDRMRSFSIPSYIRRKYLNDVVVQPDGSILYQLNKLGFQVLEKSLPLRIKLCQDRFSKLFEYVKSLSDEYLQKVNTRFHSHFESCFELHNFICRFTPFDLAVYNTLYKYRIDYFLHTLDIDRDFELRFKQMYSIDSHDVVERPKENLDLFHKLEYQSFDRKNTDYLTVLQLISYITFLQGFEKQKEYDEKNRVNSLYKSL